MEHTNSLSFRLFMSQLSHLKDVQETEKTKISLVLRKSDNTPCILRICKGRDLSSVCEALRKIRNQSTVVIYDYIYEDGSTYILEENVVGRTIEEILEYDGIFGEDRTVAIIIEVCKALEELHKETPPVVHNDINPSNIKIRDDGGVKLFDFDISRLYKKGQNQNTVLFGTEEYASPEHFGYGQSEPRTDIYCLGVTMHKMLTGQGLSSEHRITYNGKLKQIIMKCLEFDPKNRYESAWALRKDLEHFLSRRTCLMNKIVALLAIPFLIAGIWLCANFFADNMHSDFSPSSNPDISSNHSTSPTHSQTDSTNNTHSTPGTTSNNSEATLPDDNFVANHSREHARPIEHSETIADTLEGDISNWYRFTTGNETSVCRIGIYPADTEDGRVSIFPYICVAVYDTIGIKLEEFDVQYDDEYGFIDLYLEANKEYFVKVFLGSRWNSGSYEMHLSEMPCDAGINKNDATEIVLGNQHIAIIDSTLSDWYVFNATENGQYSITLHNIDVGCDIYISVQRPGNAGEGISVANEDNFSWDISVNAGDSVYIKICSYQENPDANGKYILELKKCDL